MPPVFACRRDLDDAAGGVRWARQEPREFCVSAKRLQDALDHAAVKRAHHRGVFAHHFSVRASTQLVLRHFALEVASRREAQSSKRAPDWVLLIGDAGRSEVGGELQAQLDTCRLNLAEPGRRGWDGTRQRPRHRPARVRQIRLGDCLRRHAPQDARSAHLTTGCGALHDATATETPQLRSDAVGMQAEPRCNRCRASGSSEARSNSTMRTSVGFLSSVVFTVFTVW